MRVAGLILAGGRATRMGGIDKPLITLGGRSLISLILERLHGQCGPVAISANGDPARYAGFGLPVLADERIGRGPLAGVMRGLVWAARQGADTLLTLPGDTPFIPTDLASRLAPAPAWAESQTGLHPLVALWPVGCAPALAAWLDSQPGGRVRSFGAQIGMRAVWFAEVADPFLNINTMEDFGVAVERKEGLLF